ncbi:MAG: PKD domain-containing protein, partial [Bacteroidota bacterium]
MKKLTLFSALLLLLFSVATSCKKETPQPPVASFTCDVNTGNAPMTVRFTSTSTGEISSYFWDFGDGETSSQQNPVYVYVNGGTFTATLTVTGRGGTNSYSRYFTVISSPPSASFTTDKSSGYAPLTIYFTSTSSGNITSYTWNFGDGGMSSSEDPVHTYYDAGTYTATLTVSGTSGSQTAYIIITVFGGAVNTDVTFNNPVFTDIYVTLNGNTQTISPGGSATFYGVAGSSVTYHAVTNGATTSGTQVGEQLVWDHTLTLSGGT